MPCVHTIFLNEIFLFLLQNQYRIQNTYLNMTSKEPAKLEDKT